MSKIYFNYFMLCYMKEPPSVSETQLETALSRGMLTQNEFDEIIAAKNPEKLLSE